MSGIPYFGFDIAKGIASIPGLDGDGLLVLDGSGGVHEAGDIVGTIAPHTPYFGFDVARAIVYRNVPPRVGSSFLNTSNISVTSSSYVATQSVQVYAPDDGAVVAVCNASIGCNGCASDVAWARVAIGVDSLAEVTGINRELGFRDPSFGAQAWIETLPVTAGLHTVHCLIRKSSGTPDPEYFDPTITAIFIDQDFAGQSLPETTVPTGPTGERGR